MVKDAHKIVQHLGRRRIVVADTATSIDQSNKNDIVVDGSHFGKNVGEMALKAEVLGMIGNDAGIGLSDAGIAGLKVLEEYGIPAAAVSCMSAEIGDGVSTYEEGIISTANGTAKQLGVTVGMAAKEAARKMLKQKLTQRITIEGNLKIARRSGRNRLVIVDSSSCIQAVNRNDVIVTGSHGGRNGGEYLARLNVRAVICQDAGIGKNQAGIAGLRILEKHGIPAATVSSMTACIGNGFSTYRHGKISALNKYAEIIGIKIGMSGEEAADKMFENLTRNPHTHCERPMQKALGNS